MTLLGLLSSHLNTTNTPRMQEWEGNCWWLVVCTAKLCSYFSPLCCTWPRLVVYIYDHPRPHPFLGALASVSSLLLFTFTW